MAKASPPAKDYGQDGRATAKHHVDASTKVSVMISSSRAQRKAVGDFHSPVGGRNRQKKRPRTIFIFVAPSK